MDDQHAVTNKNIIQGDSVVFVATKINCHESYTFFT
jgi:hypothetical protein